MSNGWIKLHRKIKGHWLYDRKPFDYYHAWEDILLSVEHEKRLARNGTRVIELNPGQMLTSLSKLTVKWGWSDRSKTRRFLELLISDGMVEIECNTNETLLTVANWELYQGGETQNATRMQHGCNTDETPYILNKNIRSKEDSIGRFAPPTLPEVEAYCAERKNSVDPERFINFYTAKGWMVGKNKMKDWKAAVRTWEKGEKPKQEAAMHFVQTGVDEAGNPVGTWEGA